MLLLHQVHHVRGAEEDAFDGAFRDEYLPALATSDGSRLLWYLHLAHGSGQAYTVVSITGCRDAAAWEQLAARVRGGDLAAWSAKVDAMRHSSEAKIVQPVPWSPLPGDRLRHRAGAGRDPQELPVHGGHGLALRRRTAGIPREGGHALRPDAEQPEGGGHGHDRARGRLPARLRDPHDDRGDPLAARGQREGRDVDARPRSPPRGVGPRDVAARRTGGTRPLGEPAAAQRRLVTALPRAP